MAPPSPPRPAAASQRKRTVRAAQVWHGAARRRTDAAAAMLQRIGGQLTHVSGSRSDVQTPPSPSPRPTTPAGTGDAFFDSPELAASPAISPPRDPRRRPASPKEQRQRQDTRLNQATWAPAKGRPAPRLAAPPPYPAERFISPPKPPPPSPAGLYVSMQDFAMHRDGGLIRSHGCVTAYET
ncbi:unnamed protein product [Danaus chrysippus]|uniref:(African queen) hypothetical protein n=1 Tax=Danaus chrysippus TaxID=151541 RepID=A0A8J2W496_9NEOP|nr:unnamed protein product [Danaus chrysippus]